MKITIDLETVPDLRDGAEARAADLVKVPANYKDPAKIDAYRESHADEAYRKTALDGAYGQIFCIGLAIDDRDPITFTAIAGDTERDILQQFCDHVTACADPGDLHRIEWIGFNILEFDIPMLAQRFWVNNVQPAFQLPMAGRHGQGKVFDCMRAWLCNYKGYVKQEVVCQALGIKGKDGMDGSQVYDAYLAENFEGIAEYCRDDVRIAREIYKRMTWQ